MDDHVEVRVHLLGDAAGGLSLRLLHVWLSEKELTVQVGDLNVVIVSHGHGTVRSTT